MQPAPSSTNGKVGKTVAYRSGTAASVARQMREIQARCARMGLPPIAPDGFYCDVFEDGSGSEEEGAKSNASSTQSAGETETNNVRHADQHTTHSRHMHYSVLRL